MTGRYKSEALAAAHEAALGLAEAGVMSRKTMRAFDEMRIAQVEALGRGGTREGISTRRGRRSTC